MTNSKMTAYKKDFLSILNENVSNGDLPDACAKLLIKYPIKTLFRYRSFSDYTIEELLKSHVYLSPLDKLDDIYDSKYTLPGENDANEYVAMDAAYIFTSYMAKQGYKDAKKHAVFYEKHYKAINDLAKNNIRIASFTETYDNIPMWYYYADKHRGICIEYDTSGPGSTLFPVIYPTKKDGNIYRSNSLKSGYELVTLVRNSLVKHRDWAFEKEWRMFAIDSTSENVYRDVKIKSVILGKEISKANENKIIELKKKYNLGFSIYKMEYDGISLKRTKS